MRRTGAWYRLFASFLILLLPVCGAVFLNRTIDDSLGDPIAGFKPIYLPSEAWEDQSCSACHGAVQPDPKSAFGGTWTAATYNPRMDSMNITLEFTGVAIWVFFILANGNRHDPGIATNTQCNFTLDGQYAGNFTHLPDTNTSAMQYNVTVFSRSGLANATHQLVVSTNDYPFNVFVGFDYAIYTADVDDSSPITTTLFDSSVPPQKILLTSRSLSSTSNRVSIVASVLGALALFIILVFSFLIWRLSQSKGPNYRQVQIAMDRPSRDTHGDLTRPKPGAGMLQTELTSYSQFMSSSDNLSSGPPLTPVRRYQDPPRLTSNQEKLRAMRQMEINERLQLAQREMNNLASRQQIPSSSSAGQAEMASMREEIQELRDQIEHLQAQRQSDWALGLTDEQPPAYA